MNDEQKFAMRTAAIAGTLAVIEWVSFKFLAITTAVMAGNVYYGYFTNNGLARGWANTLNVMAILLTYFIIDHGLPELLKFVFKDKSERGTSQRKFVRLIVLFVLIRVLLTATSSWWAAAEIADLTVNDDTHYYVDAKLEQDSIFSGRYNKAQSTAEQLIASEPLRLEKAEIEGAAIIRDAVESGSYHQKKMWKSNPNFFRSLSPSSKYYSQNKAYADVVFAAQEQAEQLIQAEKQKTIQAQQEAQQLTVVGDTTSVNLARVAEMRADEIAAKRQRRKNMLWVMDVIATLFGVGAVMLRSRRDEVVGEEEDERSFAFMIGQAIKKFRLKVLDELEDILNIDINNDGKIGTRSSVKHITGGGETGGVTTSGATGETRTVIHGFRKGTQQVKQPEVKQPETTVKQYVARETEKVKQPRETSETTKVKQERETVVLLNTNPRYLKQRCKQNFKRMHTQNDATTPTQNYKTLCQALNALGIQVIETTDEKGNPDLEFIEA
jgi:hypothetical protein